MPNGTIKLIMEGTEINDGDVELSLFLKELETVRAAINCIDKDTYGNNKAGLKLLVTDLSHSSPATTTIKPVYDSEKEELSGVVLRSFAEIINSVVKENIPAETNYNALEKLKTFGAQVGKKLKSATIIINEEIFDITKNFSRTVENALERGDTCIGSVEGKLEQINVHGHDKHFTVYPDIGPQKVRCIFPEKLRAEAINGIEKRVEVNGVLRFRPRAPFPHEITVQSITVQPPDSELPTFDDLLGIAPIDDKRSSEEIIREQRNGWH